MTVFLPRTVGFRHDWGGGGVGIYVFYITWGLSKWVLLTHALYA